MMVALARPGDVDDPVAVRFDEKAEGIGVRLRGPRARVAGVTGIAALAQHIDRNQAPRPAPRTRRRRDRATRNRQAAMQAK